MKFFVLLVFALFGLNSHARLVGGETRVVNSMPELQAAVAAAQPGDTIELLAGPYLSAPIPLKVQGTSEAPIRISARDGEEVLILSPLRLEGQHFSLENLRFEHEGSLTILAEDFRLTRVVFDEVRSKRWVVVESGSKRVEIDHNIFQNKTANAVHPRDCQLLQIKVRNENERHRIHHNLFRDVVRGASSNGYETLQLITENNPWDPPAGRSNTIIEDNLFVRCSGEGEIISIKSNGNWIRRNTFRASRGGLVLRHGDDNWVTHNYFFGEGEPASSGVRIQGTGQVVLGNYFQDLGRSGFAMTDGTPDDLYVQVEDATIAFNTFVNCRNPFLIGVVHSSVENGIAPRDCEIVGNVFYDDSERGSAADAFMVWVKEDAPIDWIWRNNLVSTDIVGDFEIEGVTPTAIEMHRASEGFLAPAGRTEQLEIDYDFGEISGSDIIGRQRGGRSTPGAIAMPLEIVLNPPKTEGYFGSIY
jgi:poly(beta-D-mannuronate) lyase